jgi:hypothetical protein
MFRRNVMFPSSLYLFHPEEKFSIFLRNAFNSHIDCAAKESMYWGRNGVTEHRKGNKTVPEKVATTRTEVDTNRIPNQALQYRTKGRRNVGRPRKRWRDQIRLEG